MNNVKRKNILNYFYTLDKFLGLNFNVTNAI